ncbi:MAG: hypothetical protein ACO1NM_10375 [Sphingobium phenoxybenzoativorans]|uniref:hypothetical protein n=1 Tax=Sphingobium phenoxybenzoativorans TaxID=1592790 RepID=UPI000871C0A5|nr:hypothetical protein [Sphingobium phenoxybenzoativorans]
MSFSLIALAAAAATHTVQIEHRGMQMDAIYSARTEIQTRTVGAATPNRADGQRCRWTATLVVDRKLTHGPALARILPSDHKLSGSQPGACTRDRSAIEREVARRDDAVRDHLLAVAARDQAPLLAELDAIRNLASN